VLIFPFFSLVKCKSNKLFDLGSIALLSRLMLLVGFTLKFFSEPKRDRDFIDLGGVDFRLIISLEFDRTGLVKILKLKANPSSDLRASQWVILKVEY